MNLLAKLSLAFLLLLSCSVLKAQSSELDPRLIEFYGVEHINRMNQSAPGSIDYLNFYIKNAYVIIKDLPDYKLEHFENITSVKNLKTGKFLTAEDLGNLNILAVGIKRKMDQHLTYRIGDSNDVIVFVAPDEIRRKYETEVKQ